MSERSRMKPLTRIMMIRRAGAKLALEQGLAKVTHHSVAEACPTRTSVWTVRRYMGTHQELITAIVDEADDADITVQALDLGY